jgi:hypothetical protein
VSSDLTIDLLARRRVRDSDPAQVPPDDSDLTDEAGGGQPVKHELPQYRTQLAHTKKARKRKVEGDEACDRQSKAKHGSLHGTKGRRHKAEHIADRRAHRQSIDLHRGQAPTVGQTAPPNATPHAVRVKEALKREGERVGDKGARPGAQRRKRKTPFLTAPVDLAEPTQLGARTDQRTVPLEVIGYVIPT